MQLTQNNMIQIITTTEALQEVFDAAFQKAIENIKVKETMPAPVKLTGQKELCTFLNLSEPTIIRWRQKGKIPFMKIGSAIRYDLNKVIAALEVEKKGRKNG